MCSSDLVRKPAWALCAGLLVQAALGSMNLGPAGGAMHAMLAQSLVAASACLVVMLSPRWAEPPMVIQDYGWPSLRSLSISLPTLIGLWPKLQNETRLQAVVSAQGQWEALAVHSAGDAITPRHMARAMPQLAGPLAGRFDLPDKTTAEGLYDLPYEIPHQRMAHTATRSGVPVGYWRSVGHSHNAFFSESFVDEVAHAAGADPVAFRLQALTRHPRHARVLQLAAQRAGWGQPLSAGVARGVALHESFGTVVAQVLEVEKAGERPRVRRVVCAVDCGVAVNPDGVAQQMESSVIFGLKIGRAHV